MAIEKKNSMDQRKETLSYTQKGNNTSEKIWYRNQKKTTTKRYITHLSKWLKLKRLTKPSVNKSVTQPEHSCNIKESIE